MNRIQRLLDDLRDTDSVASGLRELESDDEIFQENLQALQRRRETLSRQLNKALIATQTDLVQYHIDRPEVRRYPAAAIGKAIVAFQELVTSVFDALRTTPKQRYRPSAENMELSSLDLAMAAPTGSVVVSMFIENERLLAIQSDLDATFDRVFKLLKTHDVEGLRELVGQVGIASITKAHAWASNSADFGLDTVVTWSKELTYPQQYEISRVDALSLKEAIDAQSDKSESTERITGELIGIDVDEDRKKSYFHLKTVDGRNIEGRLSETFPSHQNWAVRIIYVADIMRVVTVKYATGEERVDFILANLSPIQTVTSA